VIGRPVRTGDIRLFVFSRGQGGSAQEGLRPGVIFQNNVGNTYSPNVVALPITSNIKRCEQLTHVLLSSNDTGLDRDSIVLCENPKTFPMHRVGPYISTLPKYYLKEIAKATLLASGFIAYLEPDELLQLHKKAVWLNKYTQKTSRGFSHV
jgi:mRNA interferase MazF